MISRYLRQIATGGQRTLPSPLDFPGKDNFPKWRQTIVLFAARGKENKREKKLTPPYPTQGTPFYFRKGNFIDFTNR